MHRHSTTRAARRAQARAVAIQAQAADQALRLLAGAVLLVGAVFGLAAVLPA